MSSKPCVELEQPGEGIGPGPGQHHTLSWKELPVAAVGGSGNAFCHLCSCSCLVHTRLVKSKNLGWEVLRHPTVSPPGGRDLAELAFLGL